MKTRAPRIMKICVGCGQPFEIRMSQAKRHKSCGRPECSHMAYSKANSSRTIETRLKIGNTRRKLFAEGSLQSHLKEFRYSGNGLTEAESHIASFLAELGFISHYKIKTGLAPRNGNANCYFLDFAHPSYKLFIEIDGRGHNTLATKLHDKKREAILLTLGWHELRLTNYEVLNNIDIATHKVRDFINPK